MKFETLMLHSLLIACLAVCALILGAMLTATPPHRLPRSPLSARARSVLLSAPSQCALPSDGVICPRSVG